MYSIILTIDVIAALAIIVLVLLQQGKGADMGVSFGAGSSNTVFGSKGSASFLFKATIFCTAVFFVGCLSLGYLGKSGSTQVADSSDKSIANQYDYEQYQKETGQATDTKDLGDKGSVKVPDNQAKEQKGSETPKSKS